jgi:hypothetical protein
MGTVVCCRRTLHPSGSHHVDFKAVTRTPLLVQHFHNNHIGYPGQASSGPALGSIPCVGLPAESCSFVLFSLFADCEGGLELEMWELLVKSLMLRRQIFFGWKVGVDE